MKKTLVVPVDFTPVSHEAMLYACEMAVKNDLEIVAVHILDDKIFEEYRKSDDQDVRKMADQMYADLLQKTHADLDNFLDGLSVFYGDIVFPLVANGTIFQAFNEVAASHNALFVVMGTHGIIGMQHIFGSKAYKVVSQSPYPFLVVQERSYNPISKMLFALKTPDQLDLHATQIANFAGVCTGDLVFNVLSGNLPDAGQLPGPLAQYANRISFVRHPLSTTSDIATHAGTLQADAIGIVIDEADNLSPDALGMTQDRILVNSSKLPVFCLPASNR